MTQWRIDVKEQRIFSPGKVLQPPHLVDVILEVLLLLQKFWWVRKVVRTRNGFTLTDFLANKTKFRAVRTGLESAKVAITLHIDCSKRATDIYLAFNYTNRLSIQYPLAVLVSKRMQNKRVKKILVNTKLLKL